jgi:hypothetical protein
MAPADLDQANNILVVAIGAAWILAKKIQSRK